jgi:hypothetical protein
MDNLKKDNSKNDGKINCFAVVRGSNSKSVITALCDLYRHAHMTFVYMPRSCDAQLADDILVRTLNRPLIQPCQYAAIVPLVDDPGSAIFRLREIHPPAHIIILSARHKMFADVGDFFSSLPKMDFSLPRLDADPERERD